MDYVKQYMITCRALIVKHKLNDKITNWYTRNMKIGISIYEVRVNLLCISFQVWICTYMLEFIPRLLKFGTCPCLFGT